MSRFVHGANGWQEYSAQSKLILFGEHSVLYGYPAVGISLDRSMRIRVRESSELIIHNINEVDERIAQNVLEHAKRVLFAKNTARSIGQVEMYIEADIPRASGFGSSAALCVCLAQYMCNINETIGEKYAVWSVANALEAVFHGRPSGIDTGLALFRGINAFYPRQGSWQNSPQEEGSSQKGGLPSIVPIHNRNLQLWLIVGHVLRESNTKEIIARLRESMLSKNTESLKNIASLGDIAQRAIHTLRNSELNAKDLRNAIAWECMQAQECLSALGLMSTAMDTILKKAYANGALGAKLSGAGCGGAFYIVCKDKAEAENINRKLAELYARENIQARSEVKLIQDIEVVKGLN